MSHASLLVITDVKPTDEDLQEILLPWHEYECTGIERYLQDVDVTADDDNRRRLFDIVSWFYNEAPAPCWGSPDKVRAWVVARTPERAMATTEEVGRHD